MGDELHLADFVDFREIFSRALSLVGKGMGVKEALESLVREKYPLVYRDILAESLSILEYLKSQKGWGSLRALRELAAREGLAEEMQRRVEERAADEMVSQAPPPVVADFPRIFALAQKKRRAGFSLHDSLEMAVRELYPQTYRKVLEASLFHIRKASRKLGVHELRALRELAEDPELFRSLTESDTG